MKVSCYLNSIFTCRWKSLGTIRANLSPARAPAHQRFSVPQPATHLERTYEQGWIYRTTLQWVQKTNECMKMKTIPGYFQVFQVKILIPEYFPVFQVFQVPENFDKSFFPFHFRDFRRRLVYGICLYYIPFDHLLSV